MNFSHLLLQWYASHGRKNLPWQNPRSPYRVWISEIMLQQTQVKTVLPYFNRFMERFPTINSLAHADEDEVLSYWSGLGYYTRARLLHKTAILIDRLGKFPEEMHELVNYPGIGPSTAAAIASLAFNKPAAILDGNVRRVLSRFFLVEGWHQQAKVQELLWKLAAECMPTADCANYTQAIMDLGATCCTLKKPDCKNCPIQVGCKAYQLKCVDQYPQKKPAKVKPIKQQQFLLLHKPDFTIYLEKQPPVGIWGGLWCFPSVDFDVCPQDFLISTYGIQTGTCSSLTEMKHSFSHFHLHIKAVELQVESYIAAQVHEGSGKWFALDELNHIGLPKPISVIIRKFIQRHEFSFEFKRKPT
jgi:A/G-specific adenine glycosylase